MARPFTDQEKLDSVMREIRMRRRVYPGLVKRDKMRADEAEWEIAIFEAIMLIRLTHTAAKTY